MEYKESLSFSAKTPNDAIKIIADNMLNVRPKADVEYRPYRKSEIYYDKHLDLCTVDLKKLYPNAKKGDIVYIDTVVDSCCETDAKLNFIGNAVVIFNQKVIFNTEKDISEDGKCRCALHLKKGKNPVRFKVKCENDGNWIFKVMPSVRWYWIWAKCYLLSARLTSPLPCYDGEDGLGISKLYTYDEEFDGVYAYPITKHYENKVDFNEIFPCTSGRYAFALTYAKNDTVLTVNGDTECFINGIASSSPLTLKKGDYVIVKCDKKSNFVFSFSDADIGIPFLKSSRESGDKWMTLGTFVINALPEIQFTSPYECADGKTFWKLMGGNDYVRPYLSSRFFGQWHYTFMVGAFGLLNASKALDNPEYLNYFCEHMRILVTYFDYMRYEHEMFSSPSFLDISSTLHDLDSIGSIGRNLCEYYKLTNDEKTLNVINVMLKAMQTNIPRFKDGIFHREHDMWADDTFMSCPFLVNAGLIKNDTNYHNEAIKQLLGFKKRLWMSDKKLFSHIYFLNTGRPNRIPWGRGNGWVLISCSDALQKISKNSEGYAELLETYKEFVKGLCAVQDENGLLHQVLDRHDSYSETSCTAMFIIGLCRGLRNGWIEPSYKENVLKAYSGLLRNKIKANGTVTDVCMGSGNSTDVNYYMQLGTVENDDHGTGVILTAIFEMINTI